MWKSKKIIKEVLLSFYLKYTNTLKSSACIISNFLVFMHKQILNFFKKSFCFSWNYNSCWNLVLAIKSCFSRVNAYTSSKDCNVYIYFAFSTNGCHLLQSCDIFLDRNWTKIVRRKYFFLHCFSGIEIIGHDFLWCYWELLVLVINEFSDTRIFILQSDLFWMAH